MGRTTRRRTGSVALLLALAVAAPSLGACSSATTTAAPATTSTGSATAHPDDDTPTGTASRGADPLVTSTAQVTRGSAAPAPSVTAPAAALRGTSAVALSYPDGVKVSLDKVVRGTTVANGPGTFNGLPYLALTLQVTNGGKTALDLNQVVVSLRYGSPQRSAQPVYQQGASDFRGSLPSGGSGTATYLFTQPQPASASAQLVVDLDGTHTPATFSGKLS